MNNSQINTAIKLLKEKATVEYIAKVTGLTVLEIEKLKYSSDLN
ncbi:hypothetical protein [Candidatus Tisiphia endosymbiont of Hybos culiciformis]